MVTNPPTARELISRCRVEDRLGNATAHEYEEMHMRLRIRATDAFEAMVEALEATLEDSEECDQSLTITTDTYHAVRRALALANGETP